QEDHIDPEMSVRCSCGVCFEFYDATANIPRVLFCGHSMCQKCIVKLLDGTRNLKCVTCQQFSNVVDATALLMNRSLIDIADIVRADESGAPKTPAFSCSQCEKYLESKEVAVCITPDCEHHRHHICLPCAIVQHEGHKIVLLEQFKSMVSEECRGKLEQIKVDSEKCMGNTVQQSAKTMASLVIVRTKIVSENRLNFFVKQSADVNDDNEATELIEIARDFIDPFTAAFARWNTTLATMDKEIKELFGMDEEQETEEGEESEDESESEDPVEEDGDDTGMEEYDIELVMSQANVSRDKAIRALQAADNDIVNA
ncbi:hypothetical protein PFISCL1PPCAC_277, partial [Pristionchus fissidentatus]